MSDDLVARLRALVAMKHDDVRVGDEAADRIEALEQNIKTEQVLREQQHALVENYAHRNRQLEAALREIADWQDLPAEGKGLTFALKKIQGMRETARRALGDAT